MVAYEIDFIGINEKSKDSDAISLRWLKNDESQVVGVYDGGLQSYGEELVKHLDKYYFVQNQEEKIIDFVICSHSDLDHASGLKRVLENFEVRALYMNRPWLYIDEVFDEASDGKITKKSLERRLKENYKFISDLEQLADKKDIPIYEAFEGQIIEGRVTVLSPTKDLYLNLLIESNKTPLVAENNSFIGKAVKSICEYVKELIESWNDEKLKESVATSAENEMSVVVLGDMDEENFLLTGDVGIRGLDKAIDYAENINKCIVDSVKFIQIPHHGGRNNISPSILNRMIGKIVDDGNVIDKVAFVSAGKDSDHPLQMVVNGFVRRGVKVYSVKGNTIHYYRNMDDREGWGKLIKLSFEQEVEEWS